MIAVSNKVPLLVWFGLPQVDLHQPLTTCLTSEDYLDPHLRRLLQPHLRAKVTNSHLSNASLWPFVMSDNKTFLRLLLQTIIYDQGVLLRLLIITCYIKHTCA